MNRNYRIITPIHSIGLEECKMNILENYITLVIVFGNDFSAAGSQKSWKYGWAIYNDMDCV